MPGRPWATVIRTMTGASSPRPRSAMTGRLSNDSASFVTMRLVVAESRAMAHELGCFRGCFGDEGGATRDTLGKHLVVWKKGGGVDR
jgi:hypothetical protein